MTLDTATRRVPSPRQALAGTGSDARYHAWPYYWALEYKVAAP